MKVSRLSYTTSNAKGKQFVTRIIIGLFICKTKYKTLSSVHIENYCQVKVKEF